MTKVVYIGILFFILPLLCLVSFPRTEQFLERQIGYYLINFSENTERKNNFEQFFKKEYIRFEAVHGHLFDDDAWPCLKGQYGYRGLQMSNVNIFKDAISRDFSYIVIFEDDAEPPPDFETKVINKLDEFPNLRVINLDNRNPEGLTTPDCCTSAVLYHKSVFDLLIRELDPTTSSIMQVYHYEQGRPCLFDWLLNHVIVSYNVPCYTLPIVPSGQFPSEIQR
jgi:hypothetical protein